MHHYKMEEGWMERCLAERGLGVLANSWLNGSHWCARMAKKVYGAQTCIRNNVAISSREVMVPLYSALLRLHLIYCVQCWASH